MAQLILEVVSRQAGKLGANRRKVVGPEGARLGSKADNDWVLPGKYMSRHHATVRYLNEMFLIENHGTNLTAINDRRRAMQRDDLQILRDGDVLFIDEYEISVRVALSEDAVDLAAIDPLQSPDAEGSFGALQRESGEDAAAGDVLKLLPDAPGKPAPKPGPRPRPDSPFGQALVDSPPPQPESETSGGSPWFKTVYPKPKPQPDKPDVAPPVTPVPPPKERPDADDSAGRTLEGLLRGIGLDPQRERLDAAVAQELGGILRIVVAGTMDVLKARAHIKSEFRLPGTQIAQSDNNPLKFSADVDDALQRLLVQRSRAYLGTPHAFEDAFEDIRYHQMAMLKGMQAGFERVLASFDPGCLDEALRPDGGLGVLTNRKARLWDSFVAMHQAARQDPEDAFRRLFGDAFGRAYEAELQRLKKPSRSTKPKRNTRE